MLFTCPISNSKYFNIRNNNGKVVCVWTWSLNHYWLIYWPWYRRFTETPIIQDSFFFRLFSCYHLCHKVGIVSLFWVTDVSNCSWLHERRLKLSKPVLPPASGLTGATFTLLGAVHNSEVDNSVRQSLTSLPLQGPFYGCHWSLEKEKQDKVGFTMRDRHWHLRT